VICADKIIAQRHGGVRSHEHRSGIIDKLEILLRCGSHDLQMLGGNSV